MIGYAGFFVLRRLVGGFAIGWWVAADGLTSLGGGTRVS